MRKYLALLVFGLICSLAGAQISNPPIIFVSTAPSGSCVDGSALRVVVSTGALYSCQAGTWAEVGGGGSGIPATTEVLKGSGSVGSAVAATPGTDYLDPSLTSAQAMAGPLTSINLNQEVYAPDYATPELAVAAACAAPSHAVYFPEGAYPVTTGMQACTGLHIRCVSPSITTGNTGSIFQAQPGDAIWMLSNPNADVASGTNAVQSVTVDNCGFDISGDAAALGTIRVKGIGFSTFTNNQVLADNNPNPAITFDGGNYLYNGGDYDNDFFGNKVYDEASAGTSTGIGVLVTNCGITNNPTTPTCTATSASGASNEDHWFGGIVVRFGTAIKIDAGGNNTFSAVDIENSVSRGIWLTTQAYGAANNNHFISPRLELLGCSGCTGIQIDSGAVSNTVITPYFSGSFIYYVDGNSPSANTCINCIFGSDPASTAQYGSTYAVGSNYENIGVNMIPSMLDGYKYGFESVHGEIQSDRAYVLGAFAGGAGYSLLHSLATAAETLNLPDVTSGSTFVTVAPSSPIAPALMCSGTASAGTYCDPVNGWTALPVAAYPKLLASVAPTTYSGTTSTGFTTIYTPSAAGSFRMCGYLDVTVAATAGTIQMYGSYFTDGHGVTPMVTTSLNAATQWASNGQCITFYGDASVPIKWELALTSVTGTPTFRYWVTLEQMQ